MDIRQHGKARALALPFPPPAAWSAHQRFHLQPVLLLTSGDQAMLGRARAGVGGTTPTDTFQSTTPTDAPLSSKIPFNPPHCTTPTDAALSSKIPFLKRAPHPQIHSFRRRYLSIHYTLLYPQIHRIRQRYLFLFNTIQSGPGQQFTVSCLQQCTNTYNIPASKEMAQGCFDKNAHNSARHILCR